MTPSRKLRLAKVRNAFDQLDGALLYLRRQGATGGHSVEEHTAMSQREFAALRYLHWLAKRAP